MNKLVTFSCLPLIVIISTVDSLNRLKRLDSRLDRDHRSFESSFEKRGGDREENRATLNAWTRMLIIIDLTSLSEGDTDIIFWG